ncbi:MAG: nitrogen regulatory protein P-II [Pirellulaceae bacterium]|nr:MAG: nitrogen regulatory protein P-II [Pirellulaceae bacterium]
MKQIIAIVRPHLAEQIVDHLRLAPLEALTVQEVKGFGRQKHYLHSYHQTEYSQVFLPKVEIIAWVDDLRVEEVLTALRQTAHSGRMGDGKIFVLPVDAMVEGEVRDTPPAK